MLRVKSRNDNDLCMHHYPNTKNIWCSDCQVRICGQCMEDHHLNHNIKSFQKHQQEQIDPRYAPPISQPHVSQKMQMIDQKITKVEENANSLKRKLSEHDFMLTTLKNVRKELQNETFRSAQDGRVSATPKHIFSHKYENPMSVRSNYIASSMTSGYANSFASSSANASSTTKIENPFVAFNFDEVFQNIQFVRKQDTQSSYHRCGEYYFSLLLRYEVQGATSLGAYLCVEPAAANDLNWQINLHFKIHLVNNTIGKSETYEHRSTFNGSNRVQGTSDLVKWGNLLNPECGWIANQSICIRVEFLRN